MADLTYLVQHAASVFVSRVAVPARTVQHTNAAYSDGRKRGTKSIIGNVYESGVPNRPVARKVRAFELVSGRLAATTWSTETGEYTLPGLAPVLHFVVAHDHLGNYNAVVKDRIEPV